MKKIDINSISKRVKVVFRIKWVRVLFSFIGLGIALFILAYLVYRERSVLFSYQWHILPLPLLFSFLLYSIELFFTILVWVKILNSLGFNLSFANHFRYFCLSNIAKRIPGTIWYVFFRGGFYEKNGLSLANTTLASGIELAVAIIGGLLASITFSIPIMVEYRVSYWGLIGLAAVCIFFLQPPVLKWILRKIKSDFTIISYRSLLVWIFSYFIFWVMSGIIVFFIAQAITRIDLQNISLVIGAWSLVGVLSNLLFFLPSNFGFTEVGLSLLLSTIMPSSIAVVVALVTRILFIVFEIIWASISWVWELRESTTTK